MAFLHGDAEHLLSNTVPLLLSLGFVFLYFEDHKWKIIITITVLSGIILWFIGEPNSNHIGASGVVYGLIAFLITHAFFTKNKETLAASFVLIFLYGGLIYGLFPDYGMLVGKNISWEGHLSGAIVGVLLALYYRKLGPQRETFFEDEEDDDDDDNWQYFPPEDDFTVNYHYRDGNNADS
jgi:membrane associated rhomboid family serine protease